MRHQQQRALVAFQGFLELLDGWKVQVVGGLIKDKEVNAAGLEQCERSPGPLAG
jgi:hypothetical protein